MTITFKNKNIRICQVIGGLNVGGAEKQFVNFLNFSVMDDHFSQLTVEALVLSKKNTKGLFPQIAPSVVCHWMPVRLILLPIEIYKLVKFLKKGNYDIVHSHMFWPNFYASLALIFCPKIDFFTSEHGMNPWKNSIHKWIERYLINPRSKKRICVSKAIMENKIKIERLSADKLVVIPNGTNISSLHSNLANNQNNAFTILSVGRLIEAKGFEILIDSAALLVSRGVHFHLYILGDGPLSDDLSKIITEKNLTQYVSLLGKTINVADWYLKSNIFVMSSHREGQPMALLEAMSYGLPIVSTAVGGIPDTVEDEIEGLLVEPGNPLLIADAIERIKNNPEQAKSFGLAARKKQIEFFSVAASVKNTIKLYGI